MMKMLEWLAAAGTVFSLYLLAAANPIGFLVGAGSNILWLTFGFRHKLFGLIALNLILLAINISGVL